MWVHRVSAWPCWAAVLSLANLGGADLFEAILFEADLSGAKYNDATKWPDGFDPVAAGAEQTKRE